MVRDICINSHRDSRSAAVSKEWTEEEIEFLKKEYMNHTASEIGKAIGRTKNAIKNKKRELGIFTIPRQEEPETVINIKPLGKHKTIPPMPGLLELLTSMAGSMNAKIVSPNARHREYLARIDLVRPQIDEMLNKGISGYKIAQAIGVPHSTVYGYMKEIKAAA
jgi:hypothetical protein